MSELEIEFLELYKRIENIINDAYHTQNGVKQYIDEMRSHEDAWDNIPGWSHDFHALKRCKAIRNHLAHELGASDITEKDYEYLNDFYDRLFKNDDPLGRFNRKHHKTYNHPLSKQKPSSILIILLIIGLIILLSLLVMLYV